MLLSFRDRTPSALTAGPSSTSALPIALTYIRTGQANQGSKPFPNYTDCFIVDQILPSYEKEIIQISNPHHISQSEHAVSVHVFFNATVFIFKHISFILPFYFIFQRFHYIKGLYKAISPL
jgi:hypothetical protein